MKRRIAGILVALFLASGVPAFAQQQKGASAAAYEHASDQSVFNRVGDWFATVGKSDQEKQQVLAERKARRTADKMKKEAAQRKQEGEKRAKEARAAADKKMREIEKNAHAQKNKMNKKMGN
ncbi:MAG: hypothetical protein ACM3L6_00020 [Deltaproteobacteria bacterium]